MEKAVPPVIAADIARETGILPSQISRWLSHPERRIGNKGLRLLGGFFGVEPRAILQHPDRYRIDKLLTNQPDEELERARALLEAGGFSTH